MASPNCGCPCGCGHSSGGCGSGLQSRPQSRPVSIPTSPDTNVLSPIPLHLHWPSEPQVAQARNYWASLLACLQHEHKRFPVTMALGDDPIVQSLVRDQCLRETECGYDLAVVNGELTCTPWNDERKEPVDTLCRQTRFLDRIPAELYMPAQKDKLQAQVIWGEMLTKIEKATMLDFPLQLRLDERANPRVCKVLQDHTKIKNNAGYDFQIVHMALVCDLAAVNKS